MRAMLLDRPGDGAAPRPSCRCRSRARGRSWSRSRPARCAGPTCTWSTASCLTRSCRSCRATRSWAGWCAPGAASTGSARATASAFRGSAPPARRCRYCVAGQENLCDAARFTGYQIDGGYAEYAVADARFCFPIPGDYGDAEAAPLLCAGLIGYRSLRHGGRRAAARHLRLRRRRPHRGPGRAPPGPRGLRLHPRRTTSRRRTSPASWARSGPAARTSARPRSSTPR